jgi:hypothetical protein
LRKAFSGFPLIKPEAMRDQSLAERDRYDLIQQIAKLAPSPQAALHHRRKESARRAAAHLIRRLNSVDGREPACSSMSAQSSVRCWRQRQR